MLVFINFTFLGVGYCILINILDFYSGNFLSYLETVELFSGLAFKILFGGTEQCLVWASYSPIPSQDSSEYSIQCSMNYEVLQSGWWDWAFFLFLASIEDCFLYLF